MAAAADETALIQEARRGSAAAFEELVRRYDRQVLRLALRMVRSEEEARDVYQETFLRIYRALPEFRGDSRFETWIFRVATNVCLDFLRRRAADPREESGAGEAPDAATGRPDPRSLDECPDRAPDRDPERALLGREIRRRIEAALGLLAPRERLVFTLRHDHGMRLAGIAGLLGTTEETVRNCLYRAHRSLRERLADLRGGARTRGDQALEIERREV